MTPHFLPLWADDSQAYSHFCHDEISNTLTICLFCSPWLNTQQRGLLLKVVSGLLDMGGPY